jgi:hypothetical protein
MGGGGHNTDYEKERIGVDKRRYGRLSKTGFQSQEQYDTVMSGLDIKQEDFTHKVAYTDSDGITSYRTEYDEAGFNNALADKGLKYDKNYKRYSLIDSGVDLDAAKEDWSNYTMEREDIATYSAKEARRKQAPTDLTGTSGNVESDLTIKDSKSVGGDNGEGTKTRKKKAIDTSASTASTNQSLGIY